MDQYDSPREPEAQRSEVFPYRKRRGYPLENAESKEKSKQAVNLKSERNERKSKSNRGNEVTIQT